MARKVSSDGKERSAEQGLAGRCVTECMDLDVDVLSGTMLVLVVDRNWGC